MSQKVAKGHDKELVEKYGQSAKGNFGVIDTIGVPHPYCIGTKHVAYASDHFMGMLGKEAIVETEKNGAHCETKFKDDTWKGWHWCDLSYEEHQQALLVGCLKEPKKDNEYGNELQTYLKKIIEIPHFKEKGFVGFTLLDKFGGKHGS